MPSGHQAHGRRHDRASQCKHRTLLSTYRVARAVAQGLLGDCRSPHTGRTEYWRRTRRRPDNHISTCRYTLSLAYRNPPAPSARTADHLYCQVVSTLMSAWWERFTSRSRRCQPHIYHRVALSPGHLQAIALCMYTCPSPATYAWYGDFQRMRTHRNAAVDILTALVAILNRQYSSRVGSDRCTRRPCSYSTICLCSAGLSLDLYRKGWLLWRRKIY